MAGSPQEVLAAELGRLHRSAGEPGTRVFAKPDMEKRLNDQ